MSQPITLFDLPSRNPNGCWSLNPWKTRLLLNYKGLEYVTQWVEYPDIQPTLEGNVEPNAKPPWPYTIPAIKLPDGKYLMESRVIANHLEQAYPTPSLHMDSPYLARIEDVVATMFTFCRPLIVAAVPRNLLNESSAQYWYPNREKLIGLSCDAFEAEHGGDKAKVGTATIFKQAGDMLREKEGPFFEGDTVGYADFVWLGALLFFKRIDESLYTALTEASGDAAVHDRLLEASAAWTKRNDH